MLGAAGEGGDPHPRVSTGPWGGPRAQQAGMPAAQVIRMSQGHLRPQGSPTGERWGQAASPTQHREAPERLGTPSQAHPAPVCSDPPASETYNASLQKRTHLRWNTGTPSPGTNRSDPCTRVATAARTPHSFSFPAQPIPAQPSPLPPTNIRLLGPAGPPPPGRSRPPSCGCGLCPRGFSSCLLQPSLFVRLQVPGALSQGARASRGARSG